LRDDDKEKFDGHMTKSSFAMVPFCKAISSSTLFACFFLTAISAFPMGSTMMRDKRKPTSIIAASSVDDIGRDRASSAASSSLTIGAVQPALRQPSSSPSDAVDHAIELIRRTASLYDGKIDLFVLPELSPIGYSEDTFQHHLPVENSAKADSRLEMYPSIDRSFSRLAKELQCYICYGTIGSVKDCNDDNAKESYTIRQNVMDDDGHLICSYDKMHLCNYGDCAETRFFVPGNQPCSFHCRGFQIGIIICADMRNPSLTRKLASRAHACDVILQPAAFSRDISFRTWTSFRETRAVENSVYFVAVNYAGSNYGNTAFVEPWVDENNEPEVLGMEEGVLVAEVKRDVLERVRREFPYYEQVMSEEWHVG